MQVHARRGAARTLIQDITRGREKPRGSFALSPISTRSRSHRRHRETETRHRRRGDYPVPLVLNLSRTPPARYC